MNALILVLAATLSLDTVIDTAEKAGADGVLLVRRGNTTIYERAWGTASCDGRERMTPAHLFDIGSITKVLTAAAAIHALPLDLRVGDVFPDAPPDKAALTVQQLLMHQSGLPDSIGDDETFIKRAFLRKLWATPLGKPGYSNGDPSLLAAMLEERTGMAYEDYLRDLPSRLRQRWYFAVFTTQEDTKVTGRTSRRSRAAGNSPRRTRCR